MGNSSTISQKKSSSLSPPSLQTKNGKSRINLTLLKIPIFYKMMPVSKMENYTLFFFAFFLFTDKNENKLENGESFSFFIASFLMKDTWN
jgi:hypothetical protein